MRREVHGQAWKGQTRILLSLAWPAILEQLLLTTATYVDTAMIGVLGADATAAVAVNSSVVFLIVGLLTAAGVGYSVQVAHSLGAGEWNHADTVCRQALLGALAVGMTGMLCMGILSRWIPLWLGADVSIRADASRYLFFYALGLPLQSCLAVFSAVLRCAGDTKTPLLFNAGANLLNIVFNFFLIFSPRTAALPGQTIHIWGAGLGVAGAAIGTALSGGIMGAAMVFLMFRRKGAARLAWGASYRPEGDINRRAARLGLPVMLERAAYSGGQLVMTRMVTSLGNISLAANHVAVTAEGISYLPAQGVSFASTALVGQAVGAKDPEQARRYSTISGVVGLAAGVFAGGLLFCLAVPLSALFTPDEQVIALAADMLRIVAVSEPLFGLSIVLSGVLRGAGDSRSPFFIVLLGMWGVRMILAPVLLYGFRLALSAIWIAMVADLMVRGLLCWIRVKRLDWSRVCQKQP